MRVLTPGRGTTSGAKVLTPLGYVHPMKNASRLKSLSMNAGADYGSCVGSHLTGLKNMANYQLGAKITHRDN
jgi:hypothetical protein